MFRALIKLTNLFNRLPDRHKVVKAYNKETKEQTRRFRESVKRELLRGYPAIVFTHSYRDEAIRDVVAELRDLGWDVRLDGQYMEIK